MTSGSNLADIDPPVIRLSAAEQFGLLSRDEKLYAHHMAKAAFSGTRIILRQASPHGEAVFDLILHLAKEYGDDWQRLRCNTRVSSEAAIHLFLDYAAMFLDNLGNFRAWGDQKFTPRVSRDDSEAICSCCEWAAAAFKDLEDAIFSPEPKSLGYPGTAVSGYYPDSPGLTEKEIRRAQDLIIANQIFSQNTRLRKLAQEPASQNLEYELLIASSRQSTKDLAFLDGTATVRLRYRDHSAEMESISGHVAAAIPFTRDEVQKAYLVNSRESFLDGDILKHKEGSKYWAQDAGPNVEMIVGFMETYRDPSGVRCEWEGLVGLKDQAKSAALDRLGGKAMQFILDLPWTGEVGGAKEGEPGAFENDEFVRPDFMAMNILAFSTSFVWNGITGPNYQDVRTTYGRKSLQLLNRANARNPRLKIPFIQPEDAELYNRLYHVSFEAIIIAHELIGHGCGKQLMETAPAEFNFDKDKLPLNPFTKQRITSYYPVGETPRSAFGSIYTSLNEFIAETIGLYLISDQDFLQLLGTVEKTEMDDVVCVGYLLLCNMGLASLATYDPGSKKWGQAHSRARFGMLKCLIEAGQGFVSVEQWQDGPSPSLRIRMDRSKIESVGRKALRNALLPLQVYRAIADVKSGTGLYEELTSVQDVHLQWRAAVAVHQGPRPLYVQDSTEIKDGEVVAKQYEESKEGLIRSWVERGI